MTGPFFRVIKGHAVSNCVLNTHVIYIFLQKKHHLANLLVSKSTTTSATHSLPPQGKALDVLLFLDSGIYTTTYGYAGGSKGFAFISRFFIIASHTWHICSLATRQLPTLRTPFLLEEKHGIFYYFWKAVGYRLCLHEQLFRLCIIVLLYRFLWPSARPVGILFL